MEDRIALKQGGDILARFVPAHIINVQTGERRSEALVQIHHVAGMTISLDRNEPLELLAFLKFHEQELLDASDPKVKPVQAEQAHEMEQALEDIRVIAKQAMTEPSPMPNALTWDCFVRIRNAVDRVLG